MRHIASWYLTGLVCAVLLTTAAPAVAQTHAGIRAGVSGDPDQFFFGGHIETRPVADHLTFRPNAEIGVGDDLTLVALNIEFAYWTSLHTNPWRVYLGGGPAAIITSGHSGHNEEDNTGFGGGFNLLIGAQHKGGLFGEFKLGLGDSPEVKGTVGVAFK